MEKKGEILENQNQDKEELNLPTLKNSQEPNYTLSKNIINNPSSSSILIIICNQ